MAKSQALALKDKVEQLENRLKKAEKTAVASAGQASSQVDMEVGCEAIPDTPKYFCLIMGDAATATHGRKVLQYETSGPERRGCKAT